MSELVFKGTKSNLMYHKEYLLNVTADSDGGEVSVET